MTKLTRDEKIKVGIGVAIMVLVLLFAASSIFTGGRSAAGVLGSLVPFGSRGSGANPTTLDEPLTQEVSFDPAEVKRLDIDWTVGDIRIERGTGEDIVVAETIEAGDYPSEVKQSTIALAVDTLTVDDNLTDEGLTIGGSVSGDLGKHVVVTLPALWGAPLDAVSISTLDADISADGLACRDLSIDALDPTVTLSDLAATRATFEMMDGEMQVSGSISESLAASYMDGSYAFTFANAALPTMTFSGMDGDVALAVPDGAGLTLAVNAMDHEVGGARADELKQTGNGVYVLGAGAARVDVSAMDGTVSIS